MKKPDPLERRREALLIAARLQRRNVAARWSLLKGQRLIGWLDSAKTLSDALRGARGLRGASMGSFAALLSSGLWSLRERSGWGALAMAMQWWLRRRRVRREIDADIRERRRGRRPGLFSFFRARRAL
jgi:hypothetical protein